MSCQALTNRSNRISDPCSSVSGAGFSSSAYSRRVYRVILDTETTGLIPRSSDEGPLFRIVQLAFYIPELKVTFDWKINPEIPIPRAAYAIHRISDSDVADAETFKPVWLRAQHSIAVSLKLQEGDAVIYIGHNSRGFDIKGIEIECHRVGLEVINFPNFDTLIFARKLFKGCVDERTVGFFKLEYLVPLLGIEDDNPHDAAGDARVTSLLFDRFVSGVDPQKVNRALLSKDPEEYLKELVLAEGDFKPSTIFEIYQRACATATLLVERHMSDLSSSYFSNPKTLAALLDLSIQDSEGILFVCWKIFLTITKGIERVKLLEALQSKDPVESVFALMPSSYNQFLQAKIQKCMRVFGLILPLSQKFFSEYSTVIYDRSALAERLRVPFVGKSPNTAETKQMFLKMTHGIPTSTIDLLLDAPEPVQGLLGAIKTEGLFMPERAKRVAMPLKIAIKTTKYQRLV